MENSDRSSTRVRNYRKSSVPRLRWTSELHDQFVEAVQKLGGNIKQRSKRIMQMMAVKGLKISHIKSHLQMYRSSMKSSSDSNGFIAIKNYQEKQSEHITLLPLRQVSQAPSIQLGRRKLTQIGENLFYHEYQGRKGSTEINIDMRKREDGEIPWANIIQLAAPQPYQINSSTSQSSTYSPINLELTMSSN